MKDKRGNQRESNVANRGAWLVVKFFVLFWAVLNRTVLPPARKEAEGVKQVQASEETGGESPPAVLCRFSRQADGRRCHVPGIGPHPSGKLSSVHPPPRVTVRAGELQRSISKVSDLYGSCPPAPQRAVLNAPRPMFNSWQTHAFSVTLAFMAPHTILLAPPQPHKGMEKSLWCIYLNQAERPLRRWALLTQASARWQRHKRPNCSKSRAVLKDVNLFCAILLFYKYFCCT